MSHPWSLCVSSITCRDGGCADLRPGRGQFITKGCNSVPARGKMLTGRAGVVAQPEDKSGSPEPSAGLAAHTSTAVQPVLSLPPPPRPDCPLVSDHLPVHPALE